VDIRTFQLMLGHADIKQTQRYVKITDEELRKAKTGYGISSGRDAGEALPGSEQ
jgi:hypothetical protein